MRGEAGLVKKEDFLLPLAESAYSRIKRAIVELEYTPGSTILEREVAEAIGVSRTPIRDAVARLEAEGWVSAVPRKGFQVLAIDAKDVEEVSEVVANLEGLCVARLAEVPDPLVMKKLKNSLEVQSRSLEEFSIHSMLQLDDRFHASIAHHADRKLTSMLLSKLIDQLHRARMMCPSTKEEFYRHIEEHRLMVRCMEMGDLQAARMVAEGHRTRAGRALSARIQSPEFDQRLTKMSKLQSV